MSIQLTIDVPDDTYQIAQHIARSTGQSVEDIVSHLLGYSLPFVPRINPKQSWSDLTDAEVIALTELQMTAEADVRHSELLEKQNAEALTVDERFELQRLDQLYRIGLVYKAQALAEAVRRGLRETLIEPDTMYRVPTSS